MAFVRMFRNTWCNALGSPTTIASGAASSSSRSIRCSSSLGRMNRAVFADQLVRRHGFHQVRSDRTGEVEQLAQQVRQAVDLVQNHLHGFIGQRRRLPRFHRETLQIPLPDLDPRLEDGQRCLHLVGNSGQQVAQGCHLVLLMEFLLQGPAVVVFRLQRVEHPVDGLANAAEHAPAPRHAMGTVPFR